MDLFGYISVFLRTSLCIITLEEPDSKISRPLF